MTRVYLLLLALLLSWDQARPDPSRFDQAINYFRSTWHKSDLKLKAWDFNFDHGKHIVLGDIRTLKTIGEPFVKDERFILDEVAVLTLGQLYINGTVMRIGGSLKKGNLTVGQNEFNVSISIVHSRQDCKFFLNKMSILKLEEMVLETEEGPLRVGRQDRDLFLEPVHQYMNTLYFKSFVQGRVDFCLFHFEDLPYCCSHEMTSDANVEMDWVMAEFTDQLIDQGRTTVQLTRASHILGDGNFTLGDLSKLSRYGRVWRRLRKDLPPVILGTLQAPNLTLTGVTLNGQLGSFTAHNTIFSFEVLFLKTHRRCKFNLEVMRVKVIYNVDFYPEGGGPPVEADREVDSTLKKKINRHINRDPIRTAIRDFLDVCNPNSPFALLATNV